MMDSATGLWSLFISAFVASTLFPGGSEALLVYLFAQDTSQYSSLLIIATLGNTLGAMTSWGIGRFLVWRFPVREWREHHLKAMQRLQDYGVAVLLLSWLPLIGDPLCVAAGWSKIHWLKALFFIAIGKLLRYWFVLEASRLTL